MTKRKPISPEKIQDVELEKVRHSELGRAIEGLEDEMDPLEDLHKQLQDTKPNQAQAIRMVLEQVDLLLAVYREVR